MTTRPIKLREVVGNILAGAHARVFFQYPPEDAEFPYLVYDLPNSFDDRPLEQFVLDIDGWDDQPDTTRLEALMGAVHEALDGRAVVVDGLTFWFLLSSRLALIDADDKRLRRRRHSYAVRTYRRR